MTSQTPAAASSALPTGTRLAEFEITGVLREGGSGFVYSAHDTSLDRQVAVKEYFPFAMAFRDANAAVQVKSAESAPVFAAGLASFLDEGRMLADFSHPALVEVIRFWEASGTAYLAMRRYDGTSLQMILRSTPQLATEAWLRQTLDPILLALGQLHRQQRYHRNIAPDNILVLPDGRPVLMGFGAARRTIDGMSQALTSVLKPGYAPVEQYSGEGEMHQGAWTDIYAIGALLYQAMTGQVPVQAVSRMNKDQLVPVTQLIRQRYSEALCLAVMKCLAVLPADRFQNIDALRVALGWDAGGDERPPAASMYATTPGSNTTRPLPSSTSVSRPSPPVATAQSHAFDPQATVSELPGVHASAPNKTTHAAAAADFDPLATVVPARPAVRRPPAAAGGDAAPAHAAPSPIPQPVSPASTPLPAPAPVSAAASAPESVSRVRDIALVGGLAAAAAISIGVLVWLFSDFSSSPAPQTATNAPAPAPAPAPTLAVVPPPPVAAPATPVAAAGPPPAVLPPPVAAPAPAEPPVVATTGVVRFELKGGWANVFVNGEDKGVTPPVLSVRLPAGTHEVELRNPALPVVKRSVTVVPGKSATLRHSFIKEQGPSSPGAKPGSTN